MEEEFNEDQLLDDSLLENGEVAGESGRSKIWRRLSYVLVGALSFMIGSFLFLPLDKLFQYGLQKVREAGYPVSVEKADLTLGGKFMLERVSYNFTSPGGMQESMKAAYVDGSVGIKELALNGGAKLKFTAGGVRVPYDKLLLSGGTWELDGDITNVNKTQDQWDGPLLIKGSDIIVRYDEYETMIRQMELNGKFTGGSFHIDPSEINSTIAKLVIQGSVQTGGARSVNLHIVVLTEALFSEKYPELQGLLQAIGVMQPNGKIELRILGTVNNPRVEPVTVAPGSSATGMAPGGFSNPNAPPPGSRVAPGANGRVERPNPIDPADM